MPLLIEKIARQANTTFSKDFTDPYFTDNFNKLLRYVSILQASDVKVTESVRKASSFAKRMVPCLYIDVFSTETFAIGIVILKPGLKIPLHDHPGMYGITKVIEGTIKISAYTSLADKLGDKAAPLDVRDKAPRWPSVFIPVNEDEPIFVGVNDKPHVMGPKEGNFHEIFATGDTAVFLDVYGPPYDMVERKCTFYKALETAERSSPIKTWLMKSPPDARFFSTNIPYFGPEIKL